MKRILFLLALTMSVLLLACSKNSDDVKTALNDTAIFSQEDINCVNNHIKEMEEFEEEDWRFTTTSKTINSSTIEYCGYYGADETNTYSTKIEKKNGIVVCTYSEPDFPSEVYYELTIPRLLNVLEEEDYLAENNNSLYQILSNNNYPNLGTNGATYGFWVGGATPIGDSRHVYLKIALGSPNNYIYQAFIVKDNNKYFFLDSTGVVASENTLEELIANTSVKNKLTSALCISSYSGTYSGHDDSGTWDITIHPDLSITGTTTSSNGTNYTLTGTLTGNTATLTATSGATLTATITNSTVSGTWTNTEFNISGTLTGYDDRLF